MRVFIILAVAACAFAVDIKPAEDSSHNTEKRQTQEGTPTHLLYRPVNKQEQVAPVEEPQEYDKGLGNGTSPQLASEDQKTNVDRQEKGETNPMTTEQTTTVNHPHLEAQASNMKQVNVEILNDQPNLRSADPISIEHNALSVEYRKQLESKIPPPRDGKSYTPEEFTSLIVSGYAVTPIPDFGGIGAVDPGLVTNTVTPVVPIVQAPLIYNPNVPVGTTLAPPIHPLQQVAYGVHPTGAVPIKASLESMPPPRNNKFYTPEEFQGLIAAGYPVAAIPVNALSYDVPQQNSRPEAEEYRPGQVFSLNPQELLDLQPERRAPLISGQHLQQLYANPQPEHKQNLQQIYYLEPQTGRQVPPSHAVIARPHFSFNGGEASVGAALSVSDHGASSTDNFDHELLALLGQPQVRAESNPQAYSPTPFPSTTVRSVAPQYQQLTGYIPKPSKKSSKLRSKVHVSFPTTEAPQQYLIETTNVQQQQQQQQQPQQSQQIQYRPTPQPQRLAQSLRYVPIAPSPQQQAYAYESPEPQGLKIVPAPKLQQLRPQFNFRVAPQPYQQQQQEAQPKQYRLVEVPQPIRAQPIRQELRLPANIERPVAYLKRYPEPEKQRSVKIYDPVPESGPQQSPQFGEQFVLRPIYRTNEQRQRYEAQPVKNERVAESTKPPHSTIYVSKNLPVPRKLRPQPQLREQADVEQINIEQHGRNIDEQRSLLPPPKNNKAYTPEEFQALVAAGYSVTPVPVSSVNLEGAQSRIEENVTPQPKRRQTQRRRNQYLPVRDDAP